MSDHHHHNHHGEIHPHQLEPPHEVFHDPKAGEVMRAWITNGQLSLALHAMAFGKPDVWGHVLAGMAYQIAGACAEMGHGTAEANLATIRSRMDDALTRAAAGPAAS